MDLTHAQVYYGRFLGSQVKRGVKWLEIGCGRQIVPDWAMPLEQQKLLAGKASLLVGVDVDPAILDHPFLHAKVLALGGDLPFAADTFDLVSANMVVEHVSDPRSFLADIYRIVRPGGRFVFHTPNYCNYLVFMASITPDPIKGAVVRLLEGRREEDRFKTFYRLNTRFRVGKIAQEAGFEVETYVTCGSGEYFGKLGVLGWLECIILKVLTINNGCFKPNMMVGLRKPVAVHADPVPTMASARS
ncbi:MAG: class I SAM-dependent methyltransferase [Acidobacteria bacterium]|nr:class I SAM-dependent methyltransferase [Acidobacteriota bacterium]